MPIPLLMRLFPFLSQPAAADTPQPDHVPNLVFAYQQDVASLGCGERLGRARLRGYTLRFSQDGLTLQPIRGDGTVPGILWRVDPACLEQLSAGLGPATWQTVHIEPWLDGGGSADTLPAQASFLAGSSPGAPAPALLEGLIAAWAEADLPVGPLLAAVPEEDSRGWQQPVARMVRSSPSWTLDLVLRPPTEDPQLRALTLEFGHKRFEAHARWADGSPVSANAVIMPAEGQLLSGVLAGQGIFAGSHWVEPRGTAPPPLPEGVGSQAPQAPSSPHVRVTLSAADADFHHHFSVDWAWDATGRQGLERLRAQLTKEAAALVDQLARQLPAGS